MARTLQTPGAARPAPDHANRAITLHAGHRPGCIGRIVDLHATYYARSHRFGLAFEAKVARELAAFCLAFDARRDGLWLALQGDDVVGSVALAGPHDGDAAAHLRWFILADGVRGQGIGTRLLAQAVGFADRSGYARTSLWTFRGLEAARHLYERQGFVLAQEQAGDQWGVVVQEQLFVRHRA